jgi:hypothetical protein
MQIAGEIGQDSAAEAKAHALFCLACGTTEVVPGYKAGLPLHPSSSCSVAPAAKIPAQIGAFPPQISQANTMKRGFYVQA